MSDSLPFPNNALLWRYVELSTLADLLMRKQLFLTRGDLLGDPFEGTLTRPNIEQREALVRKMSTLLFGPDIPSSVIEKWFTAEYEKATVDVRRWTFVTCWHLSPSESMAMWHMYRNTIAIRTSPARLATALGNSEVKVERVEYVDFETELIEQPDTATAFLRKRKEFEHEREVRGIWFDQDGFMDETWHGPFDFPLDPGRYVDVDLDQLIESVVLAPRTPTWKETVIRELLRRLAYVGTVERSALDVNPRF